MNANCYVAVVALLALHSGLVKKTADEVAVVLGV